MIAILFITLQSHAQKKLRIGVKMGAGIATVTNSSSTGLKYLPAFTIGAAINYSVSKIVSLQGEILLSQKGYKQSVNLVDQAGLTYFTGQNTVILYYTEAPLLVKVKTKGESLKLRFFVNGGVAPALHIGTIAHYNSGDDLISTPKAHIFDIGLIASAGIEYNIATMPSFLEFRINNGLSKMYDKSNTKNLTYILSTGIFF